jgi:hypothetical protein
LTNVPKLTSFLRHPHNYFLFAAGIVGAIPFFLWGQSVVIDFVWLTVFIDGISVIYLQSLALVMGWIIYKISNRFLFARYLTWVHVVVTIAAVCLFLVSGKWYQKSNATSDVQAHILKQLMINSERNISLTSKIGVVFILGQLIYLLNLTIGLFQRRAR